MAGKPTPRKRKDIQLAIATISMTAVLAFWNMFAGPDKEKAIAKAADEQIKVIPTPTEMPPTVMPMPTMPPQGYKILFGGEAPKPQKIIVQKARGGGGGGGGGNGGSGGGGGGGGAVTSTGSS